MKTKFRTLAVLCYVFSLSMPFLHAQDCTIFAGNDTLICDYSHALKGTPLGGTWELVCAESAGIATFEVLNDSITTATVSECGLYTLVYNIDIADCAGTDTIRIEFDDPDKRIDTIRSIETISYIVECHEPPPSSCTAVVTIGGQSPPEVEWNICSQVNCTTFEYEQNVIDTPIGCLADSISTDTMTTSDQGAQVCATASQSEIIDGYFDIAGGVSGGAFANASCPFPIDDCPDLGDCRDTMYLDTIFKVIPIRIGGAWTYQDEDGTFQPMNDTTFYTQNNNNFALILEPGADYYGPDDLTATFYGVDENGVLVTPVGSGGLTIQWQEIWDYDTLMQEVMVTEPLGSCCPNYIIVSSGEGPTPPDFPCGPIDLGFNSPPEYDDEFFFMCIQDFIVLVTDAPATATVTWDGPGGFPAGNNAWSVDGFEIGPGTHEFIATITDGDCVSTQRFIIEVFEDFIFIEFSYPPSCTDDGEVLPEINDFGSFIFNYFFSASGGLNIDSNTGVINLNGATPGTYTVFLEAFGECSEFFTETEITITETPEAIVQVSDIITCFNTSVTLDGSASIGEEFSWSNGLGNSPVTSVSSAGAYTLTVTTEQCFDEATIGVVEDTEPPIAIIADASLDCFNTMITLDATGSSVGAEYAYLFSTIDGNIVSGENTLNPLIDQAGTYILTVTNLNNGCEESTAITVESQGGQLTVDAGPDTLICGISYELIGRPTGGTWDILCPPSDGAAAFENQNAINTLVTVSNCGDYTFVYQVGEGDCVGVDTVVVTFDVQPSSLSIGTLDISLEYNDIECHSPAEAGCGNSVEIAGFEPPTASWEFCMGNVCTTEELVTETIGNISDCLFDSIAVETVTSSVTLNDCDNPDEVNAGTFLDILEALANGVACPPPPPSACFVETPPCPDTLIIDTVTLYIPVHESGQWHYLHPNDSLIALQDSTLLLIDTTNYEFYIEPGADYYGPDNLTFTIQELDANNMPVPLSQSVSVTIQWVEFWSTDTLVVVDSSYVALEDTCYVCGGRTVIPPVIDIPGPPDYPCGPLELNFNAPPDDIVEDYTLTCLEDCVETSVGIICNPGTYTEELMDENDCPYLVIVNVFGDIEIPVAHISQTGSLSCENTEVVLDGSLSSTGANYIYLWFDESNNIISTDIIITVTTAGTYTLIVTDNNTGCESTTSITVENESPPTAVTLQVQLDCNSQSEVIEVCSGLIISPNDINNPYFCEDENGCPIEVTVLIEEDFDAPIVNNVQTICNADNTAYIVDFEVSGTDDYTIESIHLFEEIPSCDEYQFIITGNNGCSTFIEGSHCCDCTSQAGEFSDISIVSCDDCVAAIYIDDNQVLDANDVLQFLFHTEATPAMGDILAISDEPIFCFDETTMTYNTPYYITAQVGNNDGNDSVSPDDDCAAFSESFVTSWSDIAPLTELEESICAGNCFTYNDSTLCETGVYTFVLENSLGCDSMVRLTLSPTDDMLLDWTSEAACFNSNNGMIRLDNVTGGTPPYLYSKDGENFQTEATFHDLAAGEHLFYIQDSEGCMLELGLGVPEILEMNISTDTTTHICGSEAALLHASPTNVDSMSVTYEWQDGSTKATFSAPVAGTYWVEVSNTCQTIRQELRVINDFVPIEDRIYVPNAFSPNGDEENDFFKPYTHVELMNYQFHVFDRWGNLLFYSENIKDIGWDGWFEGKVMNPAVMVWWLTADAMTCTGDMESVMMKGDVTVVR